MRITVIILIAFFCGIQLNGQELKPCGTEPFKDPWLTHFQERLEQGWLDSGSDTILYVPIKVHLLGNDDGSGYFAISRVLTAFCVLNEDFISSNIQFYLKDDFNYIDNSAWNNHADIRTGAEMMFANNDPDAINTYFVQNPAGNCGYNLPYAGIAMSKSCSGPNDHTWAHEVGHNLSLPHPFLGWEGGITDDGSQPPNFSRPAPEYVTYDYTLFKSVYYPDTLIIDTALVEKVDGSNCRESADGFCDTHPDYLARRWACGGDGMSPQRQLDPDSVAFFSDGQWIMSYANDNCSNSFTPEQIMAMRANLEEQKPNLLVDQSFPGELAASAPSLVLPEDGATVPANNIVLEWDEVEGASQYVVEVSRIRTFGLLETEMITSDISASIPVLSPDKRYYWRVTPFNSHDACGSMSTSRTFTTSEVTSLDDINVDDIKYWMVNGQLNIEIDSEGSGSDLMIQILDGNGRILQKETTDVRFKTNLYSFDLSNYATGVYFVRLFKEGGSFTLKVNK